MIQAVTAERWGEAQAAEIVTATYDRENSRRAYQNIFNYLGMEIDQRGKFITEVGCGAYPAILFCENCSGVVYEPLYFESLNQAVASERFIWYQRDFESAPYPPRTDEVWLFNVLQHVRDPEAIIRKAKQIAPVIRFFEPVDYPTCTYHPHTFSQGDFERWFGDCVKRYTDRLEGFFDSDCVYGTWRHGA